MADKNYYTIDPEGKLTCMECGVKLQKGKAKFMYLDNGFPVELAQGKVLSVEKALEDK